MTNKRINPLIEQQRKLAEEEEKIINKITKVADKKVPKIKVTLSITEEDLMTIKKMAIDNRTNVSALLHDWITEHKNDTQINI